MSLKTLALAVLIFLIVSAVDIKNAAWSASPSLADIDNQIAAAERRRSELARNLENYRTSVRQMRTRENTLLAEIERNQQTAEMARQEMAVLELQIQRHQQSISILEGEMARTRERLYELASKLRQRIVAMSRFGTTEGLLAVFMADNTHEALDTVFLLNRLAEHDRFLIEQSLRTQQDIELSQRTLEDHSGRLQERANYLEQQRRNLSAAVNQTNTRLNILRSELTLGQRAAREAEEAQAALGSTIADLMRQRSERDQAARNAGRATGNVDFLGNRIAQGRGSMFDWPLRGPVTSPFGQRTHPVFRTRMFHSGIDIAAPRGTPVRTAAPGEVLFTGWMRGYGQVIIIDHGRNFSTVYAHLSSTQVREGQIVGANAIIGAVGDTGTTTGYHLHFEVREGTTARNPLDFLRP